MSAGNYVCDGLTGISISVVCSWMYRVIVWLTIMCRVTITASQMHSYAGMHLMTEIE